MKQPKIKLRNGDEEDALTGWRKVLNFKPGQRKKEKKKYNKRLRKFFKEGLDNE